MRAIIKTIRFLASFSAIDLFKVFRAAIVILLSLHLSFRVSAQRSDNQNLIDSLQQALTASPADTNRVKILIALSNEYSQLEPRKGMQIASQALSLARDLDDVNGQINALSELSFMHSVIGQWAKGLDLSFQAIQLARDHHLLQQELNLSNIVAVAYEKQQDYRKLLEWSVKPLRSKNPKVQIIPFTHWVSTMMTARGMMKIGQVDSSYYYATQSLLAAKNGKLPQLMSAYSYASIAFVFMERKQFDSSLFYFQRARQIAEKAGGQFTAHEFYRDLAHLYSVLEKRDSVFKYATLAFEEATRMQNPVVLKDASTMLADYYEPIDKPKAIYYLRMSVIVKDSLFTVEKANQVYQIEWEERRKAIELENERQTHQSKIRQNTLLGSLTTVILIAAVVFYNSRQKQKANKLLASQKADLESALTNLKSTQSLLVQSEKMASLGELTAGIAHEIQNPLNFVNNFSEVSNELIDEMVDEANKGNIDEAKRIASDVKKNLEKVSHHGKRADGIVKSMLQHSQSGSGQRELTDINQLCDECLRLSYHGLRAKDKTFNAKFETYFDANLEKINVVPQEIGRVVLNLVNNAFYAATEKKKNNIAGFEPTISITTKKQDARPDDLVGRDKIEIIVSDNGTGIPQNILDKIFQPFFTTKPTGQGTGLGLSLSYDIVKAHNGEIKVLTEEGKGTTFIVLLPIS
jgi:two-component system NtrC family sensor kinase